MLFVMGPIADEWTADQKHFLVEALNEESNVAIALGWGRLELNDGLILSDVFPSRRRTHKNHALQWEIHPELEGIGQRNDYLNETRKELKQRQLVASRSVEVISRLIQEMRSASPEKCREQVLSNLYKCGYCRHFFLANTRRKVRKYCSRRCATHVSARNTLRRRRQAIRSQKIRAVLSALKGTRGPHRLVNVARLAGVTPNWITYATKRGDLKL